MNIDCRFQNLDLLNLNLLCQEVFAGTIMVSIVSILFDVAAVDDAKRENIELHNTEAYSIHLMSDFG